MNTIDKEFVIVDKLSNGIISNIKVFDFCVPPLVFCELTSSLVIIIKRGGCEYRHVKAVKELPEEEDFVAGAMNGNVFHIAS